MPTDFDTARKEISVLITDLDNTLFDWVDIWHRPFRAMLDEIIKISGIEERVLLPQIRAVHQKYGTSEYAFLIDEIPSLRERHEGENLVEIYDSAIHAYRRKRKEVLKLYPGVLETLVLLKSLGTLIVGYTESMAFYSNYRVRSLGLDGVFDFVYSPEDHDIPEGLDTETLRKFPASYYQLSKTIHRHTPKGELKPSAKVLSEIIVDIGAEPSECIYVGDSKMKDVAMAQEVGVVDVLAEYGASQHKTEYELLRAVSHWADRDVEREREIIERGGGSNPSHVLKASFSELLSIFSFVGFREKLQVVDGSAGGTALRPNLENVVEVWKKVVDVQQHFNDIELRIRNLFITVMAAIISAGAVVYERDIALNFEKLSISLSFPIILVGILAVHLFHFMDRHWYHRLLIGAVAQAGFIEKRYNSVFPELSLSAAIGKESPVEVKGRILKFIIGFLVSDDQFVSKGVLHSDAKIELFYRSVTVVLWGLFVGLLLIGGAKVADEHLASYIWNCVAEIFRCP